MAKLANITTQSVYSPVKRQYIWWSMIEFGSSVSSGVLDTFLVAFYMFTVLGSYTGPEAVIRASIIGFIIFSGKIIQGLANLPVAQISDRIQTRWGRRRVFVLTGCIPWGLSVFMLFFVPMQMLAVFGSEFWYAIGWLAIWYILYNIMNAYVINPYLAMLPEIAKTSSERTRYQQYRTLFTFMGIVVGAIIWPIIGETLGAFLVMGLMIITALVNFIGSREDPSIQPATISFKESFTTVIKNEAFLPYIVTIMGWMAASSVLLALLPIVVTGFFGIDLDSEVVVPWLGLEPSIVMAIVSGLFVVTAVAAIPFIGWLQRKLGKVRAFRGFLLAFGFLALGLAFVGLLPGSPDRTTNPDDYFTFMFVQLVINILLVGIPAGGISVFMYSVFSDVIDNDAFKTSERRESMYFAVQGIFDWTSSSVAALISGILLALFGSSDFGGVEDAGVFGTGSLGIRAVIIFAAFIMFLATYFFGRYPLDKFE